MHKKIRLRVSKFNLAQKASCSFFSTLLSISQEEIVAYVRRKSSAFTRGKSRYRGVSGHSGRWEARIGTYGGRKNVRSPLKATYLALHTCISSMMHTARIISMSQYRNNNRLGHKSFPQCRIPVVHFSITFDGPLVIAVCRFRSECTRLSRRQPVSTIGH